MPSRSQINGNNSRKHGVSLQPLYDVWRGLMRNPFILLCEEWLMEIGRFVADVEKDPGRRPSPHHRLCTKANGDGVFRPGNVEWVEFKPRVTKRQLRESALAHPCDPCLCPFTSAFDCVCSAGTLVRVGLDEDRQ